MKQKEFIYFLVPSFILTILWVIFSIYHNHVTSTVEDPLTYQIEPIEGRFDTNTIDAIKNRQKVNPLYEISASATPIPEEIVVEEEIIEPTPEPTPEPTTETETSTTSADEEFTP